MFDIIDLIAKNINYNTDLGLTSEINYALKRQENIREYKLEQVEGKKYKITIRLQKYNNNEARSIFKSLVNFLEYNEGTFYAFKEQQEYIECLFLSTTENKIGFFCQVIFTR